MTQLRTPHIFDREKPFYPLFMSLAVQLHGYAELFSRGMILLAQGKGISPDQPVEITYSSDLAEGTLPPYFSGEVTQLITETEFFSPKNSQVWELFSSKLSVEILSHGDLILPSLTRHAAGVMLIAAWEMTEQYHDPNSLLWEFLRHCRNAAAHKGVFNFVGKEPVRSAEWRSRQIDSNLQDMLLIDLPTEKGFITVEDAGELLWDIEQAYPEMRA